MAAGAFLELLEWLREVLLQDAVFLRESYPDHPIFQDPVSLAPSLKPIPVVAEKLRTLDEFAQATYTVTFSPGQGAAGQHAEIAELINRGAALHERRSSEQQQGMVQAGQGKPQEERMASRLGRANLRASSSPFCQIYWGARWRPSAEKNYFSTRKIIVDEVRRRAQSDGLTEDIVARQMDEERGPSSLDKLFKAIRKDRQGEKGHKRASGQFNVGGSEKSMAQ
ncbi:centromere DNA-binding protein complex CBF3 subunit, domain 2 domain-containing protein [Hirsutella rhossiliensis]